MDFCRELREVNESIEMRLRNRLNAGIIDGFELDEGTRYRICYTVKDTNKTYTHFCSTLKQAEILKIIVLKENKKHNRFKDINIYEIREERKAIL